MQEPGRKLSQWFISIWAPQLLNKTTSNVSIKKKWKSVILLQKS
jgi:hypothetical protein